MKTKVILVILTRVLSVYLYKVVHELICQNLCAYVSSSNYMVGHAVIHWYTLVQIYLTFDAR